MTFWSTKDFENNLNDIIPRTDDLKYLMKELDQKGRCKRIRESSLELSLGEQAFLSGQKELKRLNKNDDILKIEPADFALLITKEWIEIPKNCMAFISIKSKHKLSGLINISGFHVDPGFEGKLKFSVYNAGTTPVIMRYGAPTFIIFICKLSCDADTEGKRGVHWEQERIEPDEMLPLLGPGIPLHELPGKVERLSTVIKIYGGVLIGVFLLLLKLAFKTGP